MNSLYKDHLRRIYPYALSFLLVQFLIRLTLFARAVQDSDFAFGQIVQIFLRGFWFDLVVTSFCLLPIAFVQIFSKSRWGEYALRFVFLYMVIFGAVAENVFWTEFYARFNFIAVDYLVYTTEVIGNIVESYPLELILPAIGFVALILAWASLRIFSYVPALSSWKARAGVSFALIVTGSLLVTISDIEQSRIDNHTAATELAGNGVYSLFHAFRHNEIDYDRFYATQDKQKVAANMRRLLAAGQAKFASADQENLARIIKPLGAEKHLNVVIVTMESMSASFMGVFGSTEGLTPNLDRLSGQGLFLSDAYATGTRTVRGLEAIALSIPPTPGQSILRRPGNEDLFSIGSIFRQRSYDTKFIYGGYGYFDNMNGFFAANHFEIVDRTDLAKDEIEFENVWGVCDEDLFKRVIKEADASFAVGKPFLSMVMTTSNHRPYTFPEGKIDIVSKSGRSGGVKYADYSIGRLIEEAQKKPWFKDTIFIFVADHTAGAGGKAELNAQKYHIPVIFYAPHILKPENFKNLSSQIDIAPTLLGLLNFSYQTKFYGQDLLSVPQKRSFISNYQKVALVRDGKIVILEPRRGVQTFSWPDQEQVLPNDQSLTDDAIAYYQSASGWRKDYRAVDTIIK